MHQLSTIYDYMRAHSSLLGVRILQEYRALHQFDDPVSARIEHLLRKPFPAQAIAIMGLAKRWQQARTGMIVAECGTGKTLISLGAIHIHSDGNPFTALTMVPPHLVEKWAREAFLTLPRVRVFLIDDLRSGGDENKSHGVSLCGTSSLFIVGRERAKLAYFWRHAYHISTFKGDTLAAW